MPLLYVYVAYGLMGMVRSYQQVLLKMRGVEKERTLLAWHTLIGGLEL
ncbi:MAG: hypothetical protein RLO37_27800 [Coleofasciculus chthonoplastes F1-TOW-03]